MGSKYIVFRGNRAMSNLKINFQLQDLEHVMLWGEKPKASIHWFGLTDGLLWIDVGDQTIYEYSEAALKCWGGNVRYNDYQIVRFLEDFFGILRYVGESIPERLYAVLDEFTGKMDAWKEVHDDDEDEQFDEFYFGEYRELSPWYWDRTMDSGHLKGGPNIGCFRCGEKLKIIWEGDYLLEDGSSIWTSPQGCHEMPYDEFVAEVEAFWAQFSEAMDRQVKAAVEKEWDGIELDKERLVEENEERKQRFSRDLFCLKETGTKTDWEKIFKLYAKMEKELATQI